MNWMVGISKVGFGMKEGGAFELIIFILSGERALKHVLSEKQMMNHGHVCRCHRMYD